MYTAILMYSFTPAWLALTRENRNAYQAEHVQPILAAHADTVAIHMCDAEAFSATHSDFLLAHSRHIDHLLELADAIRESPLVLDGYVQLGEVTFGRENEFSTALDTHSKEN